MIALVKSRLDKAEMASLTDEDFELLPDADDDDEETQEEEDEDELLPTQRKRVSSSSSSSSISSKKRVSDTNKQDGNSI